jgi:hypothetical protein
MVLGCTSTPQYQPISVKGEWKTVDDPQMAYLSLDFADSTAVFGVRGDTILRFTYRLDSQGQAVVLTDGLKRTVSCRVLKATTDSLVFANLWDLPSLQRFVKQ